MWHQNRLRRGGGSEGSRRPADHGLGNADDCVVGPLDQSRDRRDGPTPAPLSRALKFSEAGLYDFIHQPQGVGFGSFRLDLERWPPRGLCARKELKLALLSLPESEQARPSAADSP